VWSTIDESKIVNFLKNIKLSGNPIIDGLSISKFDTFGRYFVEKIISELSHTKQPQITLKLTPNHEKLLLSIPTNKPNRNDTSKQVKPSKIGIISEQLKSLIRSASIRVEFIGQTIISVWQIIKSPSTLNFQETVRTLKNAGFDSIFVVLLLNFLIATTLAYEMAPQFIRYGANVYIVNFLGISMLKEVSPLLTAIIIAGRTGSSITAEIGTMKINEELDALKAMGISPLQKLVIPKILAIVIATPLLTALADIVGMIGGAIVANNYLNISYTMFIERTQTYVSINNYTSGIIKSIFFGLSIAFIGCLHGMLVKGDANSVGMRTTRSVVASIITIICLDAIFAIIFYRLGM
jgi:phospholipid/cholesterol/gamma-HCH transport system permease protein